ncbi:MAG: flippase [Lachnospiraceae bacterium]|nr:flippase [Lachnospiraceae bacterium]
MTSSPSLKKNFFMNAVLTASFVVFPLITFPYVSRILQPSGTGKVAFATSLISYFTMIAQLGIPTYGIRVCAAQRDDKVRLSRTVHELLVINLFMCVLSYAAFFLCLFLVPRLKEERPLYLVVSLSVIMTSLGMEWLYKGLEQYSYITVRSVAFKFIALYAMFLLVRTKRDYVIYGGITIFATSASGLLNLLRAHRFITWKWLGSYNVRQHIKPVLVFFAMTVASTIYTNLDAIMLGFLSTDTDVGYYNVAVQIKNVLVSFITSLGVVVMPRASFYVRHGEMEAFRRVSVKALQFVMVSAVPLMVYFILYAGEGILFLSGPLYGGAVLPMRMIMPTILFIGLTNILGIQILVPLERENTVLFSTIAGAVTDLVLNAALIPSFKASGAAAGTLAAEFIVLAWQYAALRKEASAAFRQIRYGAIALGTVLGCAAGLPVKMLHLPVFWALALSAVLFFGVYGCVLLLLHEPVMSELWSSLLERGRRFIQTRWNKD